MANMETSNGKNYSKKNVIAAVFSTDSLLLIGLFDFMCKEKFSDGASEYSAKRQSYEEVFDE